MPYSGTLTKAKIIDAMAEKIGFTRRKSIEAGRNIAGTYQIQPGICRSVLKLSIFYRGGDQNEYRSCCSGTR
jgi:hypothetical protein